MAPVLLGPALALAHGSPKFKTESGRTFTVGYFEIVAGDLVPTKNLTTAVVSAKICGPDSQTITEAVLWMPEHRHGSSPTTLSPDANADCVWVNDLDFSMAGNWEMRVSLEDGDKGVAKIHIHGDDGHHH